MTEDMLRLAIDALAVLPTLPLLRIGTIVRREQMERLRAKAPKLVPITKIEVTKLPGRRRTDATQGE